MAPQGASSLTGRSRRAGLATTTQMKVVSANTVPAMGEPASTEMMAKKARRLPISWNMRTPVSVRRSGVALARRRGCIVLPYLRRIASRENCFVCVARKLTVRSQWLAVVLDRLGVDQHEGDHAGRGGPVDPVVDGAALHQHVAGAERDDLVVQGHVDLARQHDG